jgi:hypothetical protein
MSETGEIITFSLITGVVLLGAVVVAVRIYRENQARIRALAENGM